MDTSVVNPINLDGVSCFGFGALQLKGAAEKWKPVDPLQHPNWDALISRNPGTSVFHGTGWAQVLRNTYGHRPFYFCRIEDETILGLLPVMEVSSPWTGRKGVSLPFTDFCTTLHSARRDGEALHLAAMAHGQRRGWRFFECRSEGSDWPGASE